MLFGIYVLPLFTVYCRIWLDLSFCIS